MRSSSTLAVLAMSLMVTGAARAATVVAHFPFDADFTDISGNGHDGSATNATRVTINTINKAFGSGSADFANTVTPATNDYVTLGANAIHFNSATAYALSFWARPTDGSGANDGGMIMGDSSNTSSFIWLEEAVIAGGGVRFRSNPSPSVANANFAVSNSLYKNGSFHHFIVQVSALDVDGIANDVTTYYDGVAQAPVKNLANTALDVNAIGQGYTSALNVVYKGQIDEVWLFNGVLGAEEVSSLFTSNSVPEPGALIGLGALGMGLAWRRGRRGC